MAPKRTGLTIVKILLMLVILALIAGTVYVISLCLALPEAPVETRPREDTIQLPTAQTAPPTEEMEPPTTLPEPEHVVATASISAQGDLLIHGGIIRCGAQTDGSYDFESNFRYIAPYIQTYDYAIANLETTFGGDGNPYQGWPLFNVPDAFGQAAVDAGYDMLLTANNHCYDTLMPGMMRTLEVSRGLGLDTQGTRLSAEEPRWHIAQVNGIPIGMITYTYTTSMQGGQPRLNGNAPVEDPALVNYFSYTGLEAFYAELETQLEEMRQAGAAATMLFIHWGTEYEVEENNYQNQIAQAVCDLGVDVIIGGHPHVVQPVELLQSAADPDHKTVCIYSLGNALSNQRISEMRLKTGHTEDGVLFSVTFEQYSDGTVYLTSVDALPTWVNLGSRNGPLEYNILPLDIQREEEWMELFNLDAGLLESCQNSWQRTMDLVGAGIEESNAWLRQCKLDRDAAYEAQARSGSPE